MFCIGCGTQLSPDQNFCRTCGHPVRHEPAQTAGSAPSAPQPSMPPPGMPPAGMAPPVRSQPVPVITAAPGVCPWCGAAVDVSQGSCPKCGATLGLPTMKAASGWTQLPARKDMAKLQIGNSSCQIEGTYVPVADMKLAAGDSVYFTHHVLLWKDTQVTVSTMSLRGGWTRMFAGLPLIMTQAAGPGHIAFSKDAPGELIPFTVQAGQSVDVREHMLLAATSNVAYDWFDTNVWFETRNDKDTEVHYPIGRFMDRFNSNSPGLLLLHAAGNIFTRTLAHGQSILVKPTALVFKDPSVDMHLHFEQPGALYSMWGSWGNRYLWLRLTGPGRVGIQSVFERIEGESRNMTRWSNATATQW